MVRERPQAPAHALYVNPIAVAWRAMHPGRPFPLELEIFGTRSDVDAIPPRAPQPGRPPRVLLDPVKEAARRERARAYNTEYQRLRRAAMAAAPAAE